MNTKVFMLTIIIGLLFPMFACNSNSERINEDDDLEQSLYLDWHSISRFSESDLNKITALKNLIPAKVITGFEEKYMDWKNIWQTRTIAALSDYTETDEYEELVKYSIKSGKAILPLIFEELNKNIFFITYLLEVMTLPEYQNLFDEMLSTRSLYKFLHPRVAEWIDFSKLILAKEWHTILQAIREISDLENEEVEVNATVTTNGQDIVLNIFSTENSNVNVKIYNVSGNLQFESNYQVTTGAQPIVINATNLNKGSVYFVQTTIDGKASSQKINF